jgi:hypothetical protein
MSTQKSRFHGLFEPQASQPEQPERKSVTKKAPGKDIMKVRNKETKKSRKEEGSVPRVKTNYELRQDYVKAFKLIAADENRKIYDLINEAMGEYLERRQGSKK